MIKAYFFYFFLLSIIITSSNALKSRQISPELRKHAIKLQYQNLLRKLNDLDYTKEQANPQAIQIDEQDSRWEKFWSLADRDQDGVAILDDLMTVLKHKNGIDMEQWVELLDKNGDGLINIEDWKSIQNLVQKSKSDNEVLLRLVAKEVGSSNDGGLNQRQWIDFGEKFRQRMKISTIDWLKIFTDSDLLRDGHIIFNNQDNLEM